jgi:hypothetical protein
VARETGETEQCSVTIAVTQLVKKYATYLNHHQVVVDAHANVSLESFLETVEANLDPVVLQIVSTSIIMDLGLCHGDPEVYPHHYPHLLRQGRPFHPLKPVAYEALMEVRNTLDRDYNLLAYRQPSFSAAEIVDPVLERDDSVVRLTKVALVALEKELERVNDQLLQTRRWNLFSE